MSKETGIATNVDGFVELIRSAEERGLVPLVVVIPVSPEFLDNTDTDVVEAELAQLATSGVRGAIRGRRQREASEPAINNKETP